MVPSTYRAPVTSSYCAPCIADLALVRDAVTSVSGTATCMAHAVLLTHSTDDPARRRQRLDALRDLATGKAETAEPAEQAKLELLVQEYGLAGAMDMGGPSRRQGGQQRQQSRPGQGGQGQGGQVHGGQVHGGQGHGGHGPGGQGVPGEERPRKSRRGRGRSEHAEGGGRDRRPAGVEGETAPVTPAPGPAGESVDGAVVPSNVPEAAGPAPTADAVTSVPEATVPAAAPSSESSYDESGASAGGGAATPVEAAGPAPAAAPAPEAPSQAPAAAPAPEAPSQAPAPADVPVPPTSAPDA